MKSRSLFVFWKALLLGKYFFFCDGEQWGGNDASKSCPTIFAIGSLFSYLRAKFHLMVENTSRCCSTIRYCRFSLGKITEQPLFNSVKKKFPFKTMFTEHKKKSRCIYIMKPKESKVVSLLYKRNERTINGAFIK